MIPVIEKGCPKDGRVRPVFIIVHGKQKLAISDGMGACYDAHEDLYCSDYTKYITPENFIDPGTYQFHRGLSGHDF